ncbi:hypothetical protein [Dokdonella sp.]|uniref:hypothetical protein n=1 Tax=Dokdonella sp. TaxID=2291710 RepID=UPI001B0B5FA2|nr:hypothetical protein [Dokdonella sp.]MBO9664730.1 hypothetical protein [Dokdonella sp.]
MGYVVALLIALAILPILAFVFWSPRPSRSSASDSSLLDGGDASWVAQHVSDCSDSATDSGSCGDGGSSGGGD